MLTRMEVDSCPLSFAESLRYVASMAFRTLNQPYCDQHEVRDILRRISRLKRDLPTTHQNPLHTWLSSLEREVGTRLVSPARHSVRQTA